MLKKHVLSAAIAAVVGGALSAPAAAQVSINGGVQARFGHLTRDGDTTQTGAAGEPVEYGNGGTSIDGLFVLFINATKDLKGGYNAGFNCVTVATTVDGANAGFTGEAIPIKHDWDKFFAGNDNWSQSQGGFSSYGDVQGDSKGVLCNDEVSGFLLTPFGRFAAGHIMNPLRNLYDTFTVNPVWANQRGYYQMADVRGNALRYSNEFGPFALEVQLNTASDAKAAEPGSKRGHALTGVVTYDFGNGFGLGAGYMDAKGDFVNKYVTAQAPNAHTAFGLAAKGRVGPVTLGYTYMGGKNTPSPDFVSTYGRDFIKEYDHTVKVGYDIGQWNFQGFVQKEYFAASTGQWGGMYHDNRFGNTTPAFGSVKIDRTRFDLWALYDMGKDVKTYLRLDTIQKKWTSPELASFSATMRSTKLEGGWLINF